METPKEENQNLHMSSIYLYLRSLVKETATLNFSIVTKALVAMQEFIQSLE